MKKPLVMMMVLMPVALFFTGQGILMHAKAGTEEAKFHSLQTEYFILAKAERESAATGSELNQKLVEIQNYPSKLLMLKLVGVGKILTGIFVLLFGILTALIMMPKRLGTVIKETR